MQGGPTSGPAVSVVVPAYNSSPTLGALLGCLSRQSYPSRCFEVVIVNDGSTDDTAEYLRTAHPRVVLLDGERRGAYAARNAGVAASRGELLAFTDADCQPHPDWLRNGVDGVLAHGWDLAAGRVDVAVGDSRSVIEKYDAMFNLRQEYYAKIAKFGATANLFVSRATFDTVGGFSQALYSGGDQRLCRAALAAGKQFGYLPDAAVQHAARHQLRQLIEKTTRVARGRATAFASTGYFFPRLLSVYLKTTSAGSITHESLGFRVEFVLLHYLLECVRIFEYTRTRMSLAASPSGPRREA